MAMKKVIKASDIPQKPHYVLMVFVSNYDNSIDVQYWVSETQDDWKEKLRELYLKDPNRKDIAAFEVAVQYKIKMDLVIE